MNSDCYLLIRFATRLSLIEAVDHLRHLTQVERWDAVNGDFSLIVKVKGDPEPVLKALKDHDDSLEASICHLAARDDSSALDTDDKPGSYLFVETEKDRQEEVARALAQLDGIVYCHRTSGSCDLVAVARSHTFQMLERLVHDHISSLDGVLRIRQNRIISLSTL